MTQFIELIHICEQNFINETQDLGNRVKVLLVSVVIKIGFSYLLYQKSELRIKLSIN